jgi:hypothetical protein
VGSALAIEEFSHDDYCKMSGSMIEEDVSVAGVGGS